ncbi:RES family NAD+ phosphorylase [Clostridium paraputrificum]|uniref:RES family NAD+ phosphorylase n=1 Tax=Clostridium paraputrificum TaxID=29363 RepID=UPI0012B88120|nr:RES family NAD+ phosphorylase [Clostridium paraputrificum]
MDKNYLKAREIWENFKSEIKERRRFFINEEVTHYLDMLRHPCDSPEERKKKNNFVDTFHFAFNGILYRSRVGDFSNTDDLKSPPIYLSNNGRCNPKGIRYLYLSESVTTSISEVRPNVGDIVTVAHFNIPISVNFFRFDTYKLMEEHSVNNRKWINNDILRNLLDIINEDLSLAVTTSSSIDYLPYQFISEYLRTKGYMGFAFDSSVRLKINDDDSRGVNYVLFDEKIFDNLEITKLEKYKIKRVDYHYTEES